MSRQTLSRRAMPRQMPRRLTHADKPETSPSRRFHASPSRHVSLKPNQAESLFPPPLRCPPCLASPDEGKPLVLDVVRRADQLLVNDQSRVKEYLPIVGLANFNKLSAKLIFGADSNQNFANRVATVQCLSTDLLACLATLMHNNIELSINETPKCSLILMDVDQSFLPIPSPIKAAIFESFARQNMSESELDVSGDCCILGSLSRFERCRFLQCVQFLEGFVVGNAVCAISRSILEDYAVIVLLPRKCYSLVKDAVRFCASLLFLEILQRCSLCMCAF
ncbi:hypothetical protein Patl1_07367 [Pistacia atlantica]|uniref:Uncharacterized protein n=1 Tax=Pistacia atlantica TaxID=434234 RepID=A0ACC1AK29_9ROSI|nr:hypothetical protein Patl1_07367 [Pistacia atlantica]